MLWREDSLTLPILSSAPLCHKRFTHQQTVDRHAVKEHNVMNCQCKKCGKSIATRRAVDHHVEVCFFMSIP